MKRPVSAQLRRPRTSRKVRSRQGRRYSRQSPEVRRKQIVRAAIECLRRGGGANLTVSSIMSQAKVSRGLVNHYFPTLSQLLVEAYKLMLDEMSSAAMADMRRRSTGSGMEVTAMIEVACSPIIFEKQHNQAWLEVWALMPSEPKLRKLHSGIYRAYHRELVGAIERVAAARRRTVDAPRLATAAIALVDGLWLNWSIDSRFVSAEEAKRAVYDLFEARLGPL